MWTGYHTAACCKGLEVFLKHLAAGRDGAMGWMDPLPEHCQHPWGAQTRKQTVCSKLCLLTSNHIRN